jgi:hypothetical protein
MAKRNAINLDATANADGFDLSGGTTARKLTVTGADITLTGTGSAVITFPTSTSTLATLALTEELDNKTLDSSVGKGTWTASGTWTLPAVTAGGLITSTAGIDMNLTSSVGITIDITGSGSANAIVITLDTSNAGNKGLTIRNATNFAHVGSLIDLSFLNATDSGKVILIANAGSGNAIDITQKDSTEAVSIKINATQANVTAADDFIAFKSTSGTEGVIEGSASAGVITYGTFTGSHWTRVDDEDIKPEMLLEIIPGSPDINNKEQLFRTRVCETKSSKAAVGVYGGRNRHGLDLVLSIGTGYIIVANKGKDVEIGEYLMSSDIRGCAELQDSTIYCNVTVAKATENIVWKGEKTKRISCIYLGG